MCACCTEPSSGGLHAQEGGQHSKTITVQIGWKARRKTDVSFVNVYVKH